MKDFSVDLRGAAAQAVAEVKDAKAGTPQKRVELCPREINFDVEYDSPEGKDYRASLKSRVLDADGRLAKMRVFASLTRGLDVSQLSQEDHYRCDASARLAVQLIDPPDWVLSSAGMDLDLLIQINSALLEHETRYFRGASRQGEGDQVEARVRVNLPPALSKADAP